MRLWNSTRNSTPIAALAAVLALVMGIALAHAVQAQPRVKEKNNIAVTGEITALDVNGSNLTVKSTNDEGITYSVDKGTTIMSGGRKIRLRDLRTGWSVALNGHQDGDTRRATYIKVVKNP
jgi:hypothetical protein